MKICKSHFVAGCQCRKRLYCQVHEPGLAAEPDAADEAALKQGREVGLLARSYSLVASAPESPFLASTATERRRVGLCIDCQQGRRVVSDRVAKFVDGLL
jgi:hypothetical protein